MSSRSFQRQRMNYEMLAKERQHMKQKQEMAFAKERSNQRTCDRLVVSSQRLMSDRYIEPTMKRRLFRSDWPKNESCCDRWAIASRISCAIVVFGHLSAFLSGQTPRGLCQRSNERTQLRRCIPACYFKLNDYGNHQARIGASATAGIYILRWSTGDSVPSVVFGQLFCFTNDG